MCCIQVKICILCTLRRSINSLESFPVIALILEPTKIHLVLEDVVYLYSDQELTVRLQDVAENPMVRHECAEALGGIGAQGVEQELAKYVFYT